MAIGFIALGRDLVAIAAGESFRLAPLGEVWFKLHSASLNMLQAGIERRIAPEVWDSVVAPALQWPTVLFFAVPGVLLLLLSRDWRGHKRRFR
ncbi:hypothetical protein [Pelagibius sp. Alg239-R121]|uniref:hypothetical protein n=1 Tax=Pelagibius sp. Alg239-R121 TaxID=2993448 RepID=UPI0024A740C6|nr:hypothetical protein [Pelagibius sp. Alg239-R121]